MNDYQKQYLETKAEELQLWSNMVIKIFGDVPTSKTLTNLDDILDLLNKVGQSKALNHTFLPSGGGLDLTNAVVSTEDGKIELGFGSSTIIVKPRSVSFHAVGDNPEWWYFRIDTLPFEQSGVYKQSTREDNEEKLDDRFKSKSDRQVEWQMSFHGEEVLEIGPGSYVDRSHWEMDHLGYDENGDFIPIPKHARIVDRQFPGGAFAIFPKYSKYNQNSSTYDGRHNKGTDIEFNNYIRRIVDALEKEEKKSNDN